FTFGWALRQHLPLELDLDCRLAPLIDLHLLSLSFQTTLARLQKDLARLVSDCELPSDLALFTDRADVIETLVFKKWSVGVQADTCCLPKLLVVALDKFIHVFIR